MRARPALLPGVGIQVARRRRWPDYPAGVTSSGHARLGRGIVASGLLAAGALVLWLIAISASWLSGCPEGSGTASAGLEQSASPWPPGAQCLAEAPASGLYVHEALPWAEVAIVGLLAAAVIVLVAGVVGAIRGLRWRDDRVGSPV